MTLSAETKDTVYLTFEQIARIAHTANAEYCECLGDTSQLAWELAEEWQRESCIRGVETLLEDPSLTPEQMHIHWMLYKAKDGWRYGETKDPVAKTHPCMRPYLELPAEQRLKDHLYHAIVKALLVAV